jgi:hypothetical protein
MDTITKENTLQTVTAKACDIADLLTGASVAADKGKNAVDS